MRDSVIVGMPASTVDFVVRADIVENNSLLCDFDAKDDAVGVVYAYGLLSA